MPATGARARGSDRGPADAPEFPSARTKSAAWAAAYAAYEASRAAYDAANARYEAALEATAASRRAKKLWAFAERFGLMHWRATTVGGTIYFHAPDVPVRLWAVSIQPAGVIWADAEIVKIGERFVTARYAGSTARSPAS